MVLIDTSGWIRFLYNRGSYGPELDRLLNLDRVVAHALVLGELLIGDLGGRREFLADYERLQYATVVPHLDVLEFVRDRELNSRGVGWMDIHLLASALVDRLQLWTANPRIAAVATELGVAYQVANGR